MYYSATYSRSSICTYEVLFGSEIGKFWYRMLLIVDNYIYLKHFSKKFLYNKKYITPSKMSQ